VPLTTCGRVVLTSRTAFSFVERGTFSVLAFEVYMKITHPFCLGMGCQLLTFWGDLSEKQRVEEKEGERKRGARGVFLYWATVTFTSIAGPQTSSPVLDHYAGRWVHQRSD